MKKQILIIPGDGIGKEVTSWGKAMLEKIAADSGYQFTFIARTSRHVAL